MSDEKPAAPVPHVVRALKDKVEDLRGTEGGQRDDIIMLKADVERLEKTNKELDSAITEIEKGLE